MIINEIELDMIRKTRSLEELHARLQTLMKTNKNVKTRKDAELFLTKLSKLTVGDYMKLRDSSVLEKTHVRV